jgi:UDP-N-acetyl-D-mannosaminuronic acid transferase (WecB/TagA/CpsF family)
MHTLRNNSGEDQPILGVNFFMGNVDGAIERICHGGLLVVPAAPALKDIVSNAFYRDAIINADLAITDSALMVLVWNRLERDSISRLSGLKYLRRLLLHPEVRTPGNTLWVMACPASAVKNVDWLGRQNISVPESYIYNAPMYGDRIDDEALLQKLKRLRVKHVVITVGGGTQERLGVYIKRNLDYLPAIHCIGAAIAFLSGDQVRIPSWADRYYLGWLFRCIAAPKNVYSTILVGNKAGSHHMALS